MNSQRLSYGTDSDCHLRLDAIQLAFDADLLSCQLCMQNTCIIKTWSKRSIGFLGKFAQLFKQFSIVGPVQRAANDFQDASCVDSKTSEAVKIIPETADSRHGRTVSPWFSKHCRCVVDYFKSNFARTCRTTCNSGYINKAGEIFGLLQFSNNCAGACNKPIHIVIEFSDITVALAQILKSALLRLLDHFSQLPASWSESDQCRCKRCNGREQGLIPVEPKLKTRRRGSFGYSILCNAYAAKAGISSRPSPRDQQRKHGDDKKRRARIHGGIDGLSVAATSRVVRAQSTVAA
ncbi:hypothetical protein MMMDOFMJ_1650 [Methylobacterium gnaphalii]|nr:hypothetical protein MMMDOFMJ_1650 [Methylobacterium gnaphalii]